jgi:hypothetical protein
MLCAARGGFCLRQADYSTECLGTRDAENPAAHLANTAKEISKYIADSGSAEATIVASDEV